MTAVTHAKTLPMEQTGSKRPWQRAKTVISYAILFALAAVFLYPFLYAVLTSFKPLP